MLIVDYADRWPVDDLLLLLKNPLLRRPQRSRALLVARPAGPWWSALRHRLGKADIDVGGSMQLPPLAETTHARRKAFTTARNAFAAVFGIPAEPIPPLETLEGDSFQPVLTVHMAALVAVDAHWRGAIPPSDPVGLSAYLLDREHDFWQTLHDHQQIATAPRAMGCIVYTATLTHPLRRDHAVAVLDRVDIAAPNTADVVLDDHALCYPRTNPDADTVLEPLYPDRIGEDFLALLTPGHSNPSYSPDPWAVTAVSRLFAPYSTSGKRHAPQEGSAPPTYTRYALSVLIEAAYRWPHLATGHLYPLLREQPQLALAVGGAALARLADIGNIDFTVLEAIEPLLPSKRHVDLDAGIAALTRRLTDHRLATADSAGRARLYGTLAWRLANAGLTEQALTATEESVKIRRQLAAADPDAFAPYLALSLTNLGARLAELGRHQEALDATQEALGLYLRAAEADSSVAPDLATALYELSAHLLALGQWAEALTVAKQSLQVWRQLAKTNLGSFNPDLATSLATLSAQLSRLGRWTEAGEAAQEAVEISRLLAAANPAAHAPDLARSLNNLGNRLAELGQHQEALEVTQEAVEIYRQLTHANPAAHEPDLARSLSNLGADLSDLGRQAEALAVTEEAVGIYRRLAHANPAAFNPNLGGSLSNLGARLAELGRHAEALAAAEQAVGIYRWLVDVNPAFNPNLSAALDNLGQWLGLFGRHQEALTAAEEAVEMYRQLAHASPSVIHDLAWSLNNQGRWLSELGRRKEALAVTEEAVRMYRRLAHANLSAFKPKFSATLGNLGAQLLELGRHQEALAAVQEALIITESAGPQI